MSEQKPDATDTFFTIDEVVEYLESDEGVCLGITDLAYHIWVISGIGTDPDGGRKHNAWHDQHDSNQVCDVCAAEGLKWERLYRLEAIRPLHRAATIFRIVTDDKLRTRTFGENWSAAAAFNAMMVDLLKDFDVGGSLGAGIRAQAREHDTYTGSGALADLFGRLKAYHPLLPGEPMPKELKLVLRLLLEVFTYAAITDSGVSSRTLASLKGQDVRGILVEWFEPARVKQSIEDCNLTAEQLHVRMTGDEGGVEVKALEDRETKGGKGEAVEPGKV